MKKMKKVVSLTAVMSLFSASMAFGAHPKGFWPYVSAFNDAMSAQDKQSMVSAGEALLNYYDGLQLDDDVAGVRYNVYYNTYPIYEENGNYAKAREALQGVIETGTYLHYDDAVIMAKSRLKKTDPKTEVYALVNSSSTYYGAKNEPRSGSLYGRVWDQNNESDMKNEGIVSFYVELGSGQSSAADFDWKISEFDDGNHAIHIALNFPQESGTVAQVNNGSLDGKINETLSYISTLNGPVFLRIGAEMNVWTNMASPEEYKAAYTRIANMARSKAPNAALIFSPSYSSSWGGNMEDFFPDASLVDWVGTSLYSNKYQFASRPSSDGDVNDMYFGLANYADPVKNLEETANLAKKYNKPIIVTEGGTGYSLPGGGEDLSSFAANRVTEMYTTVNMVYPQVKAIIYFDTNQGEYKYSLGGNSTVNAAYKSAVASNGSLMSSVSQMAPSYVPLGNASVSGETLSLGAYCDVIGQSVNVNYYVDDVLVGSGNAMPFHCNISLSGISVGEHSIKAEFTASNGFSQTKSYRLVKNSDGTATVANA
ncbi:MAG: hypothetical protein HFE62_06100 [Firmicutes bacterium]|nr:hypothetical protein [Bacillota bacterium]